jgi:transposase
MNVPGVRLPSELRSHQPDRFKRSWDVRAHLGLTRPTTSAARRQGRTKNSAARLSMRQQHVAQAKSQMSGLRACGLKTTRHRGMARARVAVARKLAQPCEFAREGDPDRSHGDDGQGDLVRV